MHGSNHGTFSVVLVESLVFLIWRRGLGIKSFVLSNLQRSLFIPYLRVGKTSKVVRPTDRKTVLQQEIAC